MSNLRKIRGELGLTCNEMAERLAVSRAMVSLLETKKMTYKWAKKIGDEFQLNPFAVLGTDVLLEIPKTKQDKEEVEKTLCALLQRND